MIINDTSRVVRKTIILQVVASPMIVNLMTLAMSAMLLENIHSTSITHDNHHLWSSYFYSTGHGRDKTGKTFNV